MPNDTRYDISCSYQNVRGLNTKVDIFYNSVSQAEFDIIAISETYLHSDVLNSELFPPIYAAYRSDRRFNEINLSTGGGVLLALKSNIKAERLNLMLFDNNFPSIDVVGCKCDISSIIVFVFVVYMPPTTTVDTFKKIFDTFEELDYI